MNNQFQVIEKVVALRANFLFGCCGTGYMCRVLPKAPTPAWLAPLL